ncbi:hypothetical protein FNW07_13550 [Flavobacterium sp. GT3R68]|nr:hypothetical protein EKL32_28480 [Flavobacterium sp. GSN2]TRW89332.1 hypothetical protein FNW07_13550 [Flavobacterium sp. GT3R68]
MRMFSFFILCLLIFSCSEKKTKTLVQEAKAQNESLILGTFDNANEIEGCAELMLDSNDTIGSHKFLFLSNFTDFGIVILNGKRIILEKDTIESRRVNENQYISVYKKNSTKVILNLSMETAYDEGGVYKGKMTIIKGNKKLERKVHGECGC